jgi:AAA+ superfamily predicted ATPase
VPKIPTPPGAEGVLRLVSLPDPAWTARWDRIVVAPAIKTRLLNYAIFALTRRGQLDAVRMPVHGLAVLAGPPGTGKTTLAGGLADRVARELPGSDELYFVEIDPHRFPSQLLGESQRGVARLFERTIPDLAATGKPTVILLDEVETLAVSRSGASLETNPVDVHRATDAVLAGIDHVAGNHPNVLFLATTNFIQGLDAAFLSRADLIEEIGLPNREAVEAILHDTIEEVGGQNGVPLSALAEICEGIDARGIRKLILRALIQSRELALDPSKLTVSDIERVLRS